MGKERRARVLIVDDEPETTTTFALMLRLEGYEVETAVDSMTALRVVTTESFDAVLLDLWMPLADGLDVLRRLRRFHPNTPVAIVTGNYGIDDATLAELTHLGAVVRYKPLWFNDLTELTRTMVCSR